MRLIDADALLEVLQYNKRLHQTNDKEKVAVDMDAIIQYIKNQPTVRHSGKQDNTIKSPPSGGRRIKEGVRAAFLQ